jgi:hypothetical protein
MGHWELVLVVIIIIVVVVIFVTNIVLVILARVASLWYGLGRYALFPASTWLFTFAVRDCLPKLAVPKYFCSSLSSSTSSFESKPIVLTGGVVKAQPPQWTREQR